MAEQPERTTIYFLLANSSTMSATSSMSGKLEQPTIAMTPGIVPRVIGAPTVLISVSIIGPRPALAFHVSLPAATCINLNIGTSRGHSSSHFPQPIHSLNNFLIGAKSPLASCVMPAPMEQRLGHTCSHIPQSWHFWANSIASSSVNHSFLLLGASSMATFTATSAAFFESRIANCSPLSTIRLTISSVSISVASSSPYMALSRQAITAEPTLAASCGVSVLIHCSSVIITSAMPALMKKSCRERGPTILALSEYLVVSRAVQQTPATSTLSSRLCSRR